MKPGPFASTSVPVKRGAPVWREVVRLTPASQAVVPQYVVQLGDGGWAMTQGRDNSTGKNATDDLILSRFSAAGKLLETRTVKRGGHGDRSYARDGQLVTKVNGVWAAIQFGSPWSWKGVYATPLCPLAEHTYQTDLQGEAYLGGKTWLRVYGQSQKGGSERDPTHGWPVLEVCSDERVLRTYDLRQIPLDAKGLPIGGRYEPEGISLGELDGIKVALLTFAVGRLGHTTARVWACPVDSL